MQKVHNIQQDNLTFAQYFWYKHCLKFSELEKQIYLFIFSLPVLVKALAFNFILFLLRIKNLFIWFNQLIEHSLCASNPWNGDVKACDST